MSVYANYDSISTNYDKNRKATSVEIYIGLILEHFRQQKNGNSVLRILDAGCGTGNYAEAFVDAKIGKLTLFDASEGMLDQARGKLAGAIKEGVIERVSQSYLPKIPADEASFDVIMFNQVLHHLPIDNDFQICKETIASAFKVLKPNGMIIINASPGEQHASHWYYSLFKKSREDFIKRHPSRDGLKKMMADAGFNNVRTIIPLDEYYWVNDDRYMNPEGPLDKAFRDGDSFWSTVDKEEFKQVMGKLKDMKNDGTLDKKFVNEMDNVRKNMGTHTLFYGFA